LRDTSVVLSSIFQKNPNNDTYTDNALLDQDILRYSLVIAKDQTPEQIDKDGPNFTHRKLAKWLIKNNSEFVTLYKGRDITDSSKIENTQKRVKNRLKDLEQLGLVNHRNIKQQKGTAEIPVYAYSRSGYVLAWFIESFDPNNKDNANEQIYNWFKIIYRVNEYSASIVIFYARFFKKCKEKGLFEYVVRLFRLVLVSHIYLRNPSDLFNEALYLIFNYPGSTDPFHITLNETLNELDANTREVFLYYQKLELERKMKILAGHPKGYEDMRFQTRSNPYLLTVEGHCKFCQHYTPLGVELLDYREKTIEDRNEMFGCVITDCPVCKIHSLFIPNLLH
jgi:hypothetical protein